MRVQTATILITCWLGLSNVAVLEAQRGSGPVTEALRFFGKVAAGNGGIGILRALRPSPASETDRTRALADVASDAVLLPDATERTKLESLEAVLIYHERQHVIEIKLIDVPMAVVGLHGRAVILISRPALRLLSVPELQATVAHEIGHEYFWTDDYAALRARNDLDGLQVLELKCDGVAVLTLAALGLNPANLYRAIDKIGRFNEVPNARWRNNGYPHPQDRERFIRALLDMIAAVRPHTSRSICGRMINSRAMEVLQRPDWHGSPVHLGELFMVRKNHVEARCVLRSHQLGWELCLQIGLNRDFLKTRVCRTQDEVYSTREQWKASMIEKGWSQ